MNTKLYLFHSNVENGFVYDDVLVISKHFNKVVLYCYNYDINLPLLPNVEINLIPKKIDYNLSLSQTIRLIFITFFDLFTIGTSLIYCKRFRFNLSLLKKSFILSKYIGDNLLSKHNNDPFLSFWFDEITLALTFLKKDRKIKYLYTRAHGRDLFENREPLTGKLPFRCFVIRRLNKTFSVSAAGTNYLKKRYKKYSNKFFTQYLGSFDFGFNVNTENSKEFTLVSIAKVRNIKRVYLIAEALYKVDIKIRWIHIGGDADLDSDTTMNRYFKAIEMLCQKNNIEFLNLGYLNHLDMINTLKNYRVNLLVSVSETEGLPVSMMEAISLGIPILATKVGGCSELVNNVTGVLLSENPDADEIAIEIKKIYDNQLEFIKNKKLIRSFWESNFNIEHNYKLFSTLIK